MTFAGPQLPPGFLKRKEEEREREREEEEEEERAKKEEETLRKKGEEEEQRPEVKKPRVAGPMLPPSFKRQPQVEQEEEEEDEEEEWRRRRNVQHDEDADGDDYGPALPPLTSEERERNDELERIAKLDAIEARAAGKSKDVTDGSFSQAAAPKAMKREAWMLVPPKPNRAPVRTAQLKSRQFSSKSGEDNIDSSVWTATPETRETAALEAAKRQLKIMESGSVQTEKERKAREINQAHNAAYRPKSLLDQHNEKMGSDGGGGGANDVSHKRFDRERDIVGAIMDPKKRAAVVKEAAVLDSKFARGKFE